MGWFSHFFSSMRFLFRNYGRTPKQYASMKWVQTRKNIIQKSQFRKIETNLPYQRHIY